ncbi:DUF2867 domain-containing protein [Antribacter gilvus]|uniref:DUF2867 domain-containing protein n=1 Tax=Antribacter gilvus TaxID=2304675 RepID=UPI000F7A2F30|nr:DUF2867 domain-containing protein [Antribacter gilvus]
METLATRSFRLPDRAHADAPWRIHEIAPDFDLEDVWALPTPGGPGDLGRLVRQFASDDDDEISSAFAVRTLFAIRWRLGSVMRWDGERSGVGSRVVSLRDRLPDDLRDGTRGPDLQAVPFRSVYQTDTEWVAELANRTVHALLHVGWVPSGDGYQGQMASLVKPAGRFGRTYMAGIRPLRRAIVYPQLIRSIGRNWPRYA